MPTDTNSDNEKLIRTLAASYNLSDIDDLIHPAEPLIDVSKIHEAVKQKDDPAPENMRYTRPGTFFENAKDWTSFGEAVLNESFQSMGLGSNSNILQNFLTRMDRHGNRYIPVNTMNYGYTFITRPRLNMTTSNLLQHPVTTLLADADPKSVSFMIRMLLDTRASRGIKIFGRTEGTLEDDELAKNSLASPLLDVKNPFFTPLCNGLTGISGWPDFNLEAATMGEDFHSGDFTFIKGCDFQVRTTELTLEFMDVQGSIILSCIFYWCLMMALQAKGVCMAYPDDIYLQRLNYTVSIYRFITDNTRRNILWWSKATGCFPKSAPIGRLFDVSNGEVTISAAKAFSVPFTANVVEYNNPGILFDFRALMRSYAGDKFDSASEWEIIPDNKSVTGAVCPNFNFMGLPDIVEGNTGIELVWKTNNDYKENWPVGVNSTDNAYAKLSDAKVATVANKSNVLQDAINKASENVIDNKYNLNLLDSPANAK